MHPILTGHGYKGEEGRPVFQNGHPVWWNLHGYKLRLVPGVSAKIILKATAAELYLYRTPSYDNYKVSWKIFYSRNELAQGVVIMHEDVVASAFGLCDKVFSASQWLIDRYGGTAAAQGEFMRYGDFLNIPCPGTGHDGDPNISVFVSDDIREAVRVFIKPQ